MSACKSFFGRVCDKCSGRSAIEDEDWRRSIVPRPSGSLGVSPRVTPRRTIQGEVRPPYREQIEWQKVCTTGGPLLRVQVCIAAKGVEGSDWFMGRLFVAEGGILVESTQLEAGYTTPLLRWEQITDMFDEHPTRSARHELLVKASTLELRIQLGSQFALEWLRETHAASAAEGDQWFSFGSAAASDEEDSIEMSEKVQVQKVWHPGHPAFDSTDAKLCDISALLAQKKKEKPFCELKYPQTTCKKIVAVMQREQWPYLALLKDKMGCRDISHTNWKESARFPSSQIRCCQQQLPVPKNPNVPEAFARLVGVPDWVLSIGHFRLSVEENQVVLLQESGSKGVKHGDNINIRSTKVWRQQGQDVAYTEYLDLIWEVKLAFYARPVKPFIEGQARQDGAIASKDLRDLILQATKELSSGSPSAGTGSSAEDAP